MRRVGRARLSATRCQEIQSEPERDAYGHHKVHRIGIPRHDVLNREVDAVEHIENNGVLTRIHLAVADHPNAYALADNVQDDYEKDVSRNSIHLGCRKDRQRDEIHQDDKEVRKLNEPHEAKATIGSELFARHILSSLSALYINRHTQKSIPALVF